MYREGTYIYEHNKVLLEYADGDKDAKIYLVNENKIVYDDKHIKICLVRNNENTKNEKVDIDVNSNYIGTWNSEYVTNLSGEDVSLGALLGSGYAKYGSKLILNENGTFENYIQPIQSGEISNTGTWEYQETYPYADKNIEGILLKYSDNREEFIGVWDGEEGTTLMFYDFDEENTIYLSK